MRLMILVLYLASLGLFPSYAFAVNEVLSVGDDMTTFKDVDHSSEYIYSRDNPNPKVNLHYEKLKARVSNLEHLVELQHELIKSFQIHPKVKPEQKGAMTFEVWSGILLAASALIVGAVGIGIAVFTYIGYNELVDKATDRATKVAGDVAQKVAKASVGDEVSSNSRDALDNLIKEGHIDELLNEKLQRFMYRGVMPESNFEDISELINKE